MSEILSKGKRKIMASLGERKMRRRHGLFMIEGRKSVADILFRYPERFKIAWIAASAQWIIENQEILREVMWNDDKESFPIYEASASDLREASALSNPADVIAVCHLPQQTALPSPLPARLYLLLDGVQDPGNLGTIIRTAHWFGVFDIFASRATADVFNPKCIQSTMGSLAVVRVHYLENVAEFVAANAHLPLIGLLLEGENIYTSSLPKTGIIVMGNEGNGISRELREEINISLTIPPADPANHAESLNVATATAITLALFNYTTNE